MSTALTSIFHSFSSKQKSNKFLLNFGFLGVAQIAIRVSRLVTTILLSRWLVPHEYGLAAIVLTSYEFIALFTRNGIGAKVVRADESDVQAVAMTAYRLTWIVCLSLMVFQFIAAWPIAWFYHDSRLALPIAAMGLVYLATPVSSIQASFQQREGRLGRIALASAVQVVADNILTALFAIGGMGLWAIILPKILVAPLWAIPVRLGHTWRPHALSQFPTFYRWKDIIRFSRSIMGIEALTTMQGNMDNFVVGYFLGLPALGLYYFAFNAGLGISLGFVTAMASAVFPHFCEVRDDLPRLQSRFRSSLRLALLTLVPMIVLQAVLAPIYVPIVFGAKWLAAIPVLSMICFSAIMRPFAAIASQCVRALGIPDHETRWQLINTAALGVALVAAAQVNVLYVACAVFAVQTIVLFGFVNSVARMLQKMQGGSNHAQ